jgi:hypothetical protein
VVREGFRVVLVAARVLICLVRAFSKSLSLDRKFESAVGFARGTFPLKVPAKPLGLHVTCA